LAVKRNLHSIRKNEKKFHVLVTPGLVYTAQNCCPSVLGLLSLKARSHLSVQLRIRSSYPPKCSNCY